MVLCMMVQLMFIPAGDSLVRQDQISLLQDHIIFGMNVHIKQFGRVATFNIKMFISRSEAPLTL